MSDEQAQADEQPADDAPKDRQAQGDKDDAEGRRGFSEGLKQGLGVLSAFKEALEETIAEARERGDLTTDRAKEVLSGAVGRAKEAAGGARERFDFATHQEVEALKAQVAELQARLASMDRGPSAPDDTSDDGSAS